MNAEVYLNFKKAKVLSGRREPHLITLYRSSTFKTTDRRSKGKLLAAASFQIFLLGDPVPLEFPDPVDSLCSNLSWTCSKPLNGSEFPENKP